jgi:predicted  nucleic acid-binding Zn-ribbon protein
MKNRFTWLLAGVLMLGISACGSSGDGDVSYDEAADSAAELAADAGEAAEDAAGAAEEAADAAAVAADEAAAAMEEAAAEMEEAAEEVAGAVDEMVDEAAEAVVIKDDFVATDPATVAIGNGQPQMVEFYAEW